jgi:hypothetical protein
VLNKEFSHIAECGERSPSLMIPFIMIITLIVVLYIFNKNSGTVMYSISTVDSVKDFDYSSRNIMILTFTVLSWTMAMDSRNTNRGLFCLRRCIDIRYMGGNSRTLLAKVSIIIFLLEVSFT